MYNSNLSSFSDIVCIKLGLKFEIDLCVVDES